MNVIKEECYKRDKYFRIATETAKQLYFFALWAGEFKCKKDFYINRKDFKSYLLIYTYNGSGILKTKSGQFDIEKNSITFIDCKEYHEYYPKEEEWDFKYFHFNGSNSKNFYKYITNNGITPVISNCVNEIETLFDKIIESVKSKLPEHICSKNIYKILTNIVLEQSETNMLEYIDAMNYIAENYMDNFNVESIANIYGMGRSSFSINFKKYAGMSPGEYIRKCRIDASKSLLKNSTMSVEKIGYSCGFSDVSSFIRTFRKVVGTSPLSYRKGK